MSQPGWYGDVLRDLGGGDAGQAEPAGWPALLNPAMEADTATLPAVGRARPLAAEPTPPPDPAAAARAVRALTGRHPRGEPPARAALRVARRLLGARATAEAHAIAGDLGRVTQPVTTCRRILVAGVAGGSGATTLAALLALAFAGHRRDRVLALDATAGAGSLSFRLGSALHWSYPDLIRSGLDGAAKVVGAGERLGVLDRPAGVALDDFWTAGSWIARYYAVSVLDGGAEGATDPRYLAHPHSLVLAVPATVDGVRAALTWLDRTGPEVAGRTVPVLVGHAPVHGLRDGPALRALCAGTPAVALEYDRSLATGAPLWPKRLGLPTVDAVLRIAGLALTIACGGRS
ncbi:MinD-like ATPase involved in chromosome partitioning or flagellar assembly [Asanoa ferruginea]|uniref:MinD-like ATPase involved in chromosome partitioning or flagellar assembly n=1 Tax=Asanoa ferruginea TaxID=53367 RepID=A0A3D9ZIV1_9ACTN|nr:hypothetical protein [Asanoa ferruginea]REF97157.1 MinD-like ATPase involved in chromosome partitioning or flagellar assembly [Asanoa ferruginea]GIF50107.1 hypothetical protein Afe04nite_46460 [Asanoa ferruginea]